MTARLAGFETLTKSARELAEAYFIPAQMERRRAQQQAAKDPSMTADSAGRRQDDRRRCARRSKSKR